MAKKSAKPRSEILTAPTLQPVVAAALPTQRAPGANANATAFQLAANKIAADHAGIVAGWPELKAAAGRPDGMVVNPSEPGLTPCAWP